MEQREILFRGYSERYKKWIYGYFLRSKDGEFFIRNKEDFSTYFVVPESIGQYTGLNRNGKEVYDGDILKVAVKYGFNSELLNEFKELKNLESINGIGLHFTGIIRIDFFRGLMFENPKNGYREPVFDRFIKETINIGDFEIIGNIHENPELLKP